MQSSSKNRPQVPRSGCSQKPWLVFGTKATVANAADAQKWIDGWRGAGAKAVNPAAKDPVVREKLGASAVEKGALMKQWSVGKAVDKLLGRNPASEDESVVANLGKTEAEKAAIVRQFTVMDRLLGRNPAARNADTLGQTDAEKAAIEKQYKGGK